MKTKLFWNKYTMSWNNAVIYQLSSSKNIWISRLERMNNTKTNSLLRVKSTLLVLKRLLRSGTLSKEKRTTGLARLQLSLKSNGTLCKLRLIVWKRKRRLRMKNCHFWTGRLMDSKLRLRNLMMFKSKRERSKREPRKPKQAEKSSKLNSISRSLPTLFKNAMKRS